MRKNTIKALFIVILVLVFITACAQFPFESDIRDLKVTFTGDDCKYDGPKKFRTGSVTFTFFNENDSESMVNLMLLTEDKTIQDMKEHIGPEPAYHHAPYWVDNRYPTYRPIPPGESYLFEFDLIAGTYAIACVQGLPFEAYFGGGFIVRDQIAFQKLIVSKIEALVLFPETQVDHERQTKDHNAHDSVPARYIHSSNLFFALTL